MTENCRYGLRKNIVDVSFYVCIAITGLILLQLTLLAYEQPELRLLGRLMRSNGAPASGEVIYLFFHEEGNCSWGLERAKDGKFYPRNPQGMTDARGNFLIKFNKEALEGVQTFCVGLITSRSGTLQTITFEADGITWVQDLSVFEKERELNLTEIPIKMVSDAKSHFGLNPR